LFGDWREEVVWRRSDNTALHIYTTTIPSTMRLFTLMHDIQYREAIAWQNVAYNQPPHPSFFLGNGMAMPPQPSIYTVDMNPGLAGDFNGDGSVNGSDLPVWQQTFGHPNAQGSWPGDGDNDGDADGSDFLIWQQNLGLPAAPEISALSSSVRESVLATDFAYAALAGEGLAALEHEFEPAKSADLHPQHIIDAAAGSPTRRAMTTGNPQLASGDHNGDSLSIEGQTATYEQCAEIKPQLATALDDAVTLADSGVL
jgi:hypothetical protein